MRIPLALFATAVSLTAGSSAPRAEQAKVPVDAPPTCTAPGPGQGPSSALTRGPIRVGTATLSHGKVTLVAGLRIKVRTGFMPTRVGATTGEHLVGLTVEDPAAIKRDGVSHRNSIDQHGLDPVRIGTRRVSLTPLPGKGRPRFKARVEELGCLERYTHPPLAKQGDAVTVWLSTEATQTYALSTGEWYEQVPSFEVALTASLDPDVQQEPGTTAPHGWIALYDFENLDGRGTSQRITNDQLVVGARLELPRHVVHVLDVRLGADTHRVDGRIVTRGQPPVVSALVRVERR